MVDTIYLSQLPDHQLRWVLFVGSIVGTILLSEGIPILGIPALTPLIFGVKTIAAVGTTATVGAAVVPTASNVITLSSFTMKLLTITKMNAIVFTISVCGIEVLKSYNKDIAQKNAISHPVEETLASTWDTFIYNLPHQIYDTITTFANYPTTKVILFTLSILILLFPKGDGSSGGPSGGDSPGVPPIIIPDFRGKEIRIPNPSEDMPSFLNIIENILKEYLDCNFPHTTKYIAALISTLQLLYNTYNIIEENKDKPKDDFEGGEYK